MEYTFETMDKLSLYADDQGIVGANTYFDPQRGWVLVLDEEDFYEDDEGPQQGSWGFWAIC